MELGWMLYFLVVFGFGGLLLIGSVVYLIRELLIERASWSGRIRRSKIAFVSVTLLSIGLFFVPLHMVWVTRVGALPGKYRAEGVWGNATLELNQDSKFIETWHFKNEYNGKVESDGSPQGQWNDDGRDWLTRNIVLEHFRPLASYDRGIKDQSPYANVMGYGGSISIEVDAGAEIMFVK
jgi:hypothetical protein